VPNFLFIMSALSLPESSQRGRICAVRRIESRLSLDAEILKRAVSADLGRSLGGAGIQDCLIDFDRQLIGRTEELVVVASHSHSYSY
jgi:hypothetical protein